MQEPVLQYHRESVNLDSSFMFAELGPLENLKAKVYRRGVKSIHRAVKAEDFLTTLGTCFSYHMIGEILEDSVVTQFICLGQIALGYRLAHT